MSGSERYDWAESLDVIARLDRAIQYSRSLVTGSPGRAGRREQSVYQPNPKIALTVSRPRLACRRRPMRGARYSRGRIRTRPGSITEKWPTQSFLDVTKPARRRPTSLGFCRGMRNNTTPHVPGNGDALANSPKSLSKVSRIRSSRAARASTSGSPVPGASILTHATSCPADRSAGPLCQENFRWRGSAFHAGWGTPSRN